MGLSRKTEGEDRTRGGHDPAGPSNRVECQFNFPVPSFTFFSLRPILRPPPASSRSSPPFPTFYESLCSILRSFLASREGREMIPEFSPTIDDNELRFTIKFIIFIYLPIRLSLLFVYLQGTRCLSVFFFFIKEFCVFMKFIRHP